MKSVYVFKSKDNLYKIGISENVEDRLKQLQTGNPYITCIYKSKKISNPYEVETLLHKQYKEFCINSEWFKFDNIEEVLQTIKKTINNIGKEEEKTEEDFDIRKTIIWEKLFKNIEDKISEMEEEIKEEEKENWRIHDYSIDLKYGYEISDYTNLIYKTLFGKNASELRDYFGIDKRVVLKDYLTPEQLKAVENIENIISGLIGIGWNYDEIKEFITKNFTMNLLEA